MARQLSLFDAACAKGRVIRQGEIVQFVMDGSGALVCPSQDFMVAQKWAQSRTGSTNTVTDRGRFLEKLEVLIARPGSFVISRGSTRALTMLAKQMVGAGYDLTEWGLPHEVKLALAPPAPPAPVKKAEPAPEPAPESAPTAQRPVDWL